MIKRINLLPHELRVIEKGPFYVMAVVSSVLFFAFLYFVHSGQQAVIERLSSELTLLGSEMASIKAQSDKAREITDKINSIEARKRDLEERAAFARLPLQHRIAWSGLLYDLSQIVPSGVWLSKISSFDVTAGVATVKGVRLNGMALSNSGITDFIDVLENSSHFEKTGMTYAHNVPYEEKEAFAFDLTSNIVVKR